MVAKLKKNLGFWGVVAFAMGPMLSSGLFLLPGLVFAKVGPSAIAAYVVAALLVVPAMLSQAELATAMPKAGGAYYFLDRSMGPLIGTISGFGTWMSLAFKSAFDLIGLGAYLVLLIELPVKPVAAALAVLFAGLAISGMKNVGRFQGVFVSLVLAFMVYFVGLGFFSAESSHFTPFFVNVEGSFLEAIGLVYISFAGLTKIASVAEEVDDLDRNIPYGMMTALTITLVVYVLGLVVMIGVIPGEALSGTLTPVAQVAEAFMGPVGQTLMTAAAILAFVASANAGITAASRYPLAMSRDKLLGPYWKKIGRFHTPTRSIMLTMGLMVLFILLLSTEGIAELGSAFMMLVFGMLNLAVVVMRESKIIAYDPAFNSKLYPWIQIVGIIAPVILIPELGVLPMIMSAGVVGGGALWYFLYARHRVERSAAMYQVFERMGMQATPELHEELRDIIRKKGARPEDIFEQCIFRAAILRHKGDKTVSELYHQAASVFAERLEVPAEKVYQKLTGTTEIGDTPIGHHVALPHAKMAEADHPELVIIHSQPGVSIKGTDEPIHAIFLLVSPAEHPRQHLRFLAELAKRAEKIDFGKDWRNQYRDDELRSLFIRSEDEIDIQTVSQKFGGTKINQLSLPTDCSIAVIKRENQTLVPQKELVLREGDQLTLIGDKEGLKKMKEYLE